MQLAAARRLAKIHEASIERFPTCAPLTCWAPACCSIGSPAAPLHITARGLLQPFFAAVALLLLHREAAPGRTTRPGPRLPAARCLCRAPRASPPAVLPPRPWYCSVRPCKAPPPPLHSFIRPPRALLPSFSSPSSPGHVLASGVCRDLLNAEQPFPREQHGDVCRAFSFHGH